FQTRNGVGGACSPVVNTDLDAQDMLRVVSNTAHRLVDLGRGDVLQLANAYGQRGETSRAEVHDGILARISVLHNVEQQRRVIAPTGAASIYSGRDTRG